MDDMTPKGAVANAARLLQNAELETDLGKMDRLANMADSWLAMAALLYERETV